MQFNKAAFKKFLGKTRAGEYSHAPALKKPRPAPQHITLAQDAEETPLQTFKHQKKLDSKCNEELLKEFDLSIGQVYNQLQALLTERTQLLRQKDELVSMLAQANKAVEEKAMELESLGNQLDATKKEVEKMIVDMHNLRKEADAAKAEVETLQIRGEEVAESAKKKANEAVAEYKKSEEYEADLNLYAQSAYFGGFMGCKSQVAKRYNELDLSFLDAEAALEDDIEEPKVATHDEADGLGPKVATNDEADGLGPKVATNDEAAVEEPEASLEDEYSSTEPEDARENECDRNKPEVGPNNEAGVDTESSSRNLESSRDDEAACQDNQFDDGVGSQDNQFEPGDAFDGGAAMQDESGSKNAENLTYNYAASQATQSGDEVASYEHKVATDNDAANNDASEKLEASTGGYSADAWSY